MMISPESYYAQYLAGKSEQEVMTKIRGLKREINRLKDCLENPISTDPDTLYKPSPQTRIWMSRYYLEKAKKALAECGATYSPTKVEVKAQTFNDNAAKIQRIFFRIGCFGGRTHARSLTFSENDIEWDCELNYVPANDEATEYSKEEFLNQFRDLFIGEWKPYYDLSKYDIIVMDGIQWELNISYSENIKSVSICGDNAFPYNFGDLLDLLGVEMNDAIILNRSLCEAAEKVRKLNAANE